MTTIGERIWADAVRETRFWLNMPTDPDDRLGREFHAFARVVIRMINASHNVQETRDGQENYADVLRSGAYQDEYDNDQ